MTCEFQESSATRLQPGIKGPGRLDRRRRRPNTLAIATAVLVLALAPALALGQTLIQTFFVPLPETQVRVWADSIQDLAENETIHSVISITITTDGTIIHYDQWENGFEPSLANPIGLYTGAPDDPGTQIWGDGVAGNGAPPGYPGDLLNAGDVIVAAGDVPLGATNTRDPAQVFFDGGDKFASTQLLAVTRAAWPSSGVQAQLGGAVEVFDTSEWGNAYQAPLGSDMTQAAFEFVAFSILAREDLTRISVDANADGDLADPGDVQDLLLDQGESILVSNAFVGAEVTSDGLVQVGLLTANQNTTYEGRWYSMLPTSAWGASYYSPVGTTVGGNPTHAYIYNPDPTSTITVTQETRSGTVNFNVGPGAQVERLLPTTTPVSAAHYFTPGAEPFYAVAATDRNNTIHDWGYTLIPEARLTIRAAVGWAPGSTNLSENASPIWVTPIADATFNFDCDGDSTPEFTQFVQALESYRLFVGAAPPAGCTAYNATGLQIDAVDGGGSPVKFAAAWGQDPANASSGQPQQLDMGTSVVPLATPFLSKEAELAADLNGNGILEPGDSLLFTITILASGTADIDNVVLTDTPDSNVVYVVESTLVDGLPIPDQGTTPFPVDEGGINLGTLSPGQLVTVSYEATVVDPLPAGVTGIVNTAEIIVDGTPTTTSTSSSPVQDPLLLITKSSDAVSDVVPGQEIEYTITLTNNSPTPQTSVEVSDLLPFDTSYVDESTTASGPARVSKEDLGPIAINGTTTCGGGDIVRTFTFVEAFVLADVNFGFVADHTWRGDIRVTLQSPIGTRIVTIVDPTVGDSDNNYDLLLDDASAAPLDDGNADDTTAPFYERPAAPSNPLAGFNGEGSAGTWRMEICDLFPGADNGTYRRARLDLAGPVGATITKSNQAAAPLPLLDGVPPDLVEAGDGFGLLPGETLTVTFRVTAGSDPNVTRIVNTATATSSELPYSVGATVIDPVSPGGLIGDRVWLDVDGDGVQDVGEPGIANVRVWLDTDGDGMFTSGVDLETVTDAGGGYAFQHLPPDDYQVFVDTNTLPSGLRITAGGANFSDLIAILGEEQIRDVDFGYTLDDPGTAIIGDRVWADADGDGVQDAGELGIAGVVVNLLNLDGTPALDSGSNPITAVTAADGSYLLTGIPPGEYRVEIDSSNFAINAPLDAADGWAITSGPQSQGDILSAPQLVAAGDVVTNVDFGFDRPGLFTVSDSLWLDADADGSRDLGEPGITGVTVDLVGPGPDGMFGTIDDEILATTTSGGNGDFSFPGVSDGDYQIRISDITGELTDFGGTTTPAEAGLLDVTVAGADVSGVSFGYVGGGVIGDRVWSDADGDGVQDPGEPGLPGVVVNLRDAATGAILSTVTTGADGSYSFEDLPPGSYVAEVDSSNFASGGALEGATQTGDPTFPGVQCVASACSNSGSTVIDFGSADLSLDFGYQLTALADVSGTVWHDTDADGANEGAPDEPGIDGVTVELVPVLAGGVLGPPIAMTVTAADGSYLFPDVPDGDYQVQVTDTGGVLEGYTLTSGLDAIDVTVAGAPVTEVDFGYVRQPQTASIGDTVFIDLDPDGAGPLLPNGFPDPGEPGLPGVVLDLYADVDGDGVLEPTVEVLGGRIDLDGNGSVDGFDDGALAGINIIDGQLDLDGDGIIESNGEDDGTFNGAVVDDGLIVWPDGTLAGDDGLPLATTVTDADGRYLFDRLAAGNYFVDLREGTLPDSTADGLADLVETSYPVGVDPSAVIALAAGERQEDTDFGYLPRPGTAVVGDRVWHDGDADGAQDDGEAGIQGVDIIVSGSSGDVTATSGFDGFWLVTGLPAASTLYSVNYDAGTVPPGMTRTFPSDTSYQVTVDSGDFFSHLDYGFTGGSTGTVGDFVCLDLNGDGDGDPGEPGIAGVTLSLIRDTNGDGVWDPAGADGVFGTTDDERIVETTTTDAGGSYRFTGLSLADAGDGDGSDADYMVDVTDSGAVLAGLQKTAGTPDTENHSQADPYPVTLDAVTTSVTTGDFGYTPAGGFGSIGNKVWRDLDGDGFRDGGELGIEGVTVELWLDVDGDGVLTPGTDNLVRAATTDANGEYEFQSVPFGDYLIDVTDDLGVLAGFVRTTGSLPGDDYSKADPYALTLASASDVTADFGYRADPSNPVLTIAGTVFEDVDNDATFDDGSEPETENATVFLFRDLDNNGVIDPADPLVDSVETDVNGEFLFGDLPPGEYLVAVDVSGTAVDGLLQTTQTSSGGVEPVSLVAANSSGHDFGFWNGGVVTNPITLAWFQAEERGAGVHFEWMTATETGNIGFNLYAVGESALRRLNDELIPSAVIDSLEPQRYEFDAWDAVEESFVLEDVDLLGVRRYHGPFARGEESGAEPQPERIPWGEIRAERAARRSGRRDAAPGFGPRSMSSRRPGPISTGPSLGSWPAARLEVSESGIHRVSYEQLLAAGVDLTGAPVASLALVHAGEAVAIRVESHGRFGPGAFVEFIGEALDTLYTRTNVYTLEVEREQALRVYHQNRPASPWAVAPSSYAERLAVNRDQKYILTAPGEEPWYEDHLLAYGGSASREFSVEVDGYAGGPATLEVELWGLSQFPRSPDHHVALDWNGSSLGEEWFDGQVVHRVTTELASGHLIEGINGLELTLPGDGGTPWDMVAMDRLWVSYARRFVPRQGRLRFTASAEAFEVEGLSTGDVVVYRIDGDRPVLVGGLGHSNDENGARVRFAGQSGDAVYNVAEVGALLAPGITPVVPSVPLAAPARLLVISHGDFLREIQPLVDARRAEGWTVGVVDVEEIYLRESAGVVDPEALRRYIDWAHRQRQTEAVLLVGGDTYDYHDNLGLGSISFIPSLYVATDAVVRFAPVDPLYGDVDDDGVPEVAVGRLPVRTPEELTALVTRILEYGDVDFSGTALLTADGYDAPAGYSFTAASDDMAAGLPGDWALERAYIDELGRAEARQQLIQGINDGVALTSYFGHSGPTAWSFDNLFSGADAAALENSGRPTVVTQWGCWNNYHVTPSYNTLGHKLLLSGDRGAAAVLGAATLTQAHSERKLGKLLFARLGQPGVTLGQALVEAKRELAETEPDLVDVILGWTLLGDPTLQLGR